MADYCAYIQIHSMGKTGTKKHIDIPAVKGGVNVGEMLANITNMEHVGVDHLKLIENWKPMFTSHKNIRTQATRYYVEVWMCPGRLYAKRLGKI